jgi:hypothetical protein
VGGGLRAVGLQEGVKDRIGKYSVLVVQMIVSGVLRVNVKPFSRVRVGS